nr:hypothetical protein [Tanacetum cinerariifolium]
MIVAQQADDVADEDVDKDVILKDVTSVEKTVEIEENADDDELEPAELKEVMEVVTTAKLMTEVDDELEPAELKEVVELVTTAKLMTEVVTAAFATITAAATPITATTITVASIIPTLLPSPIAEPSLPPQQQQPSQPTHDAEISLDLLHTLLETCTTLTRKVEALEQDKVAQFFEIIKLTQRVKKLERKNKLKVSGLRRLKKAGTAQRVNASGDTVMDDVSKQREIIANIDADEDVTVKDVAAVAKEVDVEKDAEIEENVDVQGRQAESQAQIYKIDLEHADNVLSMQDDERKGVVIRDPEETATSSIIIHTEPKSKDRGKGIMYFNSNVAFLEKTKEQLEEEKSGALKRTSEILKRKQQRSRSWMKREDLDVLWQIVKERFTSSKPKNFSDDFLLIILTYMFEKPDVQAQVWKNQRSVHGLAKVKSWRLLES